MTEDRKREMKQRFIKALAHYLAGGYQTPKMSILLQMGDEDAKSWAAIRNQTPLFGYPTEEEAEAILTEFLT